MVEFLDECLNLGNIFEASFFVEILGRNREVESPENLGLALVVENSNMSLLAPATPHIAEEFWAELGMDEMLASHDMEFDSGAGCFPLRYAV